MMNKSISSAALKIIEIMVVCTWITTLLPHSSLPSQHTTAFHIVSSGGSAKGSVSTLPGGQGVYESCSPRNGATCLNRLKQMAAAGFKLVVNYDQLGGNAQQELAYAQQASALKMKIIWDLSNPVFWDGTNLMQYYDELAANCGCSDNNGFIRYLVNFVKNLPATWGYYVGDEVEVGNHARMRVLSNFIRQLDPSHPRLFIASEDTTGSDLAPFIDSADVLGQDVYPIGTTQSIMAVGSTGRAIQAIANQSKKQSVVVLQAFSWGQYPKKSWSCNPFPTCAPYPTMDQMRQMISFALQYTHPQFILWYSYFDIARSDNPTAHWADLVKAASTIATSSSHISFKR